MLFYLLKVSISCDENYKRTRKTEDGEKIRAPYVCVLLLLINIMFLVPWSFNLIMTQSTECGRSMLRYIFIKFLPRSAFAGNSAGEKILIKKRTWVKSHLLTFLFMNPRTAGRLKGFSSKVCCEKSFV